MEKNKESLRQKVFRDGFWNLSASLISRIGGLIFTILLARFLLPEGFGLYSLATSVALMFLTFADLGINQAMIRFVSAEIEKNKAKASAYYRYILNIKLKWSLIVSFLLIILAYPLSHYLFRKDSMFFLFIILGFYIFILAICGFFESLFYVVNKVKYISIKEAILQFSRIFLVLLVFYFAFKTYHLLGVMVVLLITILMALSFLIYFSRKAIRFKKVKSIKIDKARVLRFIRYLTLGNLSLLFFGYIDTILLGIFVSSAYVGYYRAASTLVFGLAGLISFTNIFLPILTKINEKKISEVFNKIIKYSFILAVPATFGIIFLAKYTLKAIYGGEYLQAAFPLYFLAPVIILNVLFGNSFALFSAREKPAKFAKLTFLATLINLGSNFILITLLLKKSELWAIAGAAMATLISWIVYSIGTIILSKKQLNIQINVYSIIKPLFASLIMSLFLYVYNSFIPDMTLIKGIIEIISSATIYFLVLLAIKGITRRDIESASYSLLK